MSDTIEPLSAPATAADLAGLNARLRHRMLVVLDTSASDNANGLYARCGYTRVGVIPRYATDPDGPLIDTVIYYKELAAQPAALPERT
jgi:ribosomal protein S18 acetylase RimI-like enzyme